MKKINQAVILAGGLGTRLRPFTETAPKPMYPFEDRPFIYYLIQQVKEFGIEDILILLGYLPEKVMDYLGDGKEFGVKIAYDITPVEYETGLRLKFAYDKIEDYFLLMYCDNYCPINYYKLAEDFIKNNAMIQLTSYKNRENYTKDNLKILDNGLVEIYDKNRMTPNLKGVDIGYAIIDKKTLDLIPDDNVNFEYTVYPKLVQQKSLYSTITEHRYYSIGSWKRIELAREFFKNKKCVFLDRDGTINVRPPRACYVEKWEEFNWINGAKEAIKKLNDHGYLVILVSNQPGIARGNLTEDILVDIHNKMQTELEEIGAHIDKIYFCPHNWDEGCTCRKPKPGMLFQAQKDFSLNLKECVFFGDDERDMEAAKAANCKGILISEEYSLYKAVDKFLEENRR